MLASAPAAADYLNFRDSQEAFADCRGDVVTAALNYEPSIAGWTNLGGAATSRPAAVSAAPGEIDLFVRGVGYELVQRHSSDGGASWGFSETRGGFLSTGPSAASSLPGTIDVFAGGGDRAMWTRQFSGGIWHEWSPLGGALLSPPAAVSAEAGDVDVFIRGLDQALWVDHREGPHWGSWSTLGGIIR